jgi:hypothetical protein
MKAFVRHAVMLLAATATCQAGIAMAEEWVFGGNQPATLIGEEKAAAPAQSPCGSCGEVSCCDESCGSCGIFGAGGFGGCDGTPQRGIVGFAGLDSFKGVSDGSYQSNFGAVTGLNASLPVPGLSDYGIGWQLGTSYGVYDFDGRIYAPNNRTRSQQQIFVTTGFFRKAAEGQRLSAGLVYDWMINDQWGVYGTSPTLGQWRGQIEYSLSECNAIGVWGCARDLASRQEVLRVPVDSRAISQVNLFWHHKFDSGADSWLWAGAPESTRLGGDASLGTWMVGANVQVPLSDRLALYGNGSYFRPSAAAGAVASVESGYDVGMGVVWYFGRHAVNHSINGACWLPYMPVANNSTFLVDQHPTYYP